MNQIAEETQFKNLTLEDAVKKGFYLFSKVFRKPKSLKLDYSGTEDYEPITPEAHEDISTAVRFVLQEAVNSSGASYLTARSSVQDGDKVVLVTFDGIPAYSKKEEWLRGELRKCAEGKYRFEVGDKLPRAATMLAKHFNKASITLSKIAEETPGSYNELAMRIPLKASALPTDYDRSIAAIRQPNTHPSS